MRELLIDALLDLSGDELSTFDDMVEIAKESEIELVQRLIFIANFYRDEAQ